MSPPPPALPDTHTHTLHTLKSVYVKYPFAFQVFFSSLVFIPRYIQTVIDLILCKSKMPYVCMWVYVRVLTQRGENYAKPEASRYLPDRSLYLICGPLAPPSRCSLPCLFFGKNKTWKKKNQKNKNTITIKYNKTF